LGVLWPFRAILENYAPVQAGAQFGGVGGSQKRSKKNNNRVLFVVLFLVWTFLNIFAEHM